VSILKQNEFQFNIVSINTYISHSRIIFENNCESLNDKMVKNIGKTRYILFSKRYLLFLSALLDKVGQTHESWTCFAQIRLISVMHFCTRLLAIKNNKIQPKDKNICHIIHTNIHSHKIVVHKMCSYWHSNDSILARKSV
jgi:hypothetical protein